MATFTYIPDFAAELTKTPRVEVIKFGDSYEQRTQFGANVAPDIWSLSFNLRTAAERDTILTFLRARKGVENFDWTPPYGGAGKYICTDWKNIPLSTNNNQISATFKRVFE